MKEFKSKDVFFGRTAEEKFKTVIYTSMILLCMGIAIGEFILGLTVNIYCVTLAITWVGVYMSECEIRQLTIENEELRKESGTNGEQ